MHSQGCVLFDVQLGEEDEELATNNDHNLHSASMETLSNYFISTTYSMATRIESKIDYCSDGIYEKGLSLSPACIFKLSEINQLIY